MCYAVLINLSGICVGSNYQQYLALFAYIDQELTYHRRHDKKYRLLDFCRVAAVGDRWLKEMRVDDFGKIYMSGDKYIDGDAMCCPSAYCTVCYVYDAFELREIK